MDIQSKTFIPNITAAVLIFVFAAGFSPVLAQTPSTEQSDVAAGNRIYTQIIGKTLPCSQVTDDQFDQVGDYVMQQMMGNAHDVMDQMMTDRFGDSGEKNVHITMGRRATNCVDDNEATPSGYYGMMGTNSMMGNFQNGPAGWITPTKQPGFLPFSNSPIRTVEAAVIYTAVLVFLISGSVYFWKNIKK